MKKAFACVIAAQLCVACVPAAAFAVVNSQDDSGAITSESVEADASLQTEASPSAQASSDASPLSSQQTAEQQADEDQTSLLHALADKAADFDLNATVHESQTWAALYAKGGLFDQASAVAFAVWSQDGGQNDLVWYGARHDADGSWAAAVGIERHASAGIYEVHVYATVGGALVGVGSTQFEIAAPTANVTIENVGNGSYTVKVSGISSPSGVSSVHVPTWTTADGQDDIFWHEASESNGSWMVTIDARAHGGQDGTYESHVYLTSGNGVCANVGAKSVDVKCENYIYVTGPLGSGKRTVYVKNPAHAITAMPTWSEDGGQDDIVWWSASSAGPNLWAATIDCHSLKHAGRVVTHAYSDAGAEAGIAYDVNYEDIVPAEHRAMLGRVQGLASSSNYLIAADTNRCIVGIYQGSQGNWAPITYFPCSPGAPGSPSRKGIFTVGDKGYAFGTSAYTCYYYTQYSGNYLFHSVLYYPGTRAIKDGRLGMHLSHGCIRLAIDNAKWIHDNVPSGSRVLVY